MRQIIAVRSAVVLPYLLPRLISPPITVSHTRVLAAIVDVAGKTLYMNLTSLLPALLHEMYNAPTPSARDAACKAAEAIVGQVREDAVHLLFREFFAYLKNPR